MQNPTRPKYLNLFTIGLKMSITAKISILHRISGFLLFLAIPFILFILNQSLVRPDFYTTLYGICSSMAMKLVYIAMVFSFMYHMISGVRFLFLDIDKGVEIKTAKATAVIVLLVSIVLSAVLGVLIW